MTVVYLLRAREKYHEQIVDILPTLSGRVHQLYVPEKAVMGNFGISPQTELKEGRVVFIDDLKILGLYGSFLSQGIFHVVRKGDVPDDVLEGYISKHRQLYAIEQQLDLERTNVVDGLPNLLGHIPFVRMR